MLSLRPLTGQKGDFQKSRTAATPKEETKHVDVKNTVSDRISVSDSNPQGLFNRLESKRQSSRRKSKSSQKQSDGTSKPSVETKKREVPHRSSSISGLLTVDTRKHSRINNVSKSDDKQSLSTVTERMETSHLRRTRSLPNRTNRSKYTSSSRESQDPSSSGRPQPTARTRRVVLVSDARGPIGPETASTYDASRDSGANNPSSNPAEGNSMAAPPTSRMVSATSMPTRTLSNRSTRSTKYIESPRNGRSQSKWCCCS